ncbi:hypothetical protein Forpe1208_v010006 [Fusarium oxysporum f. sp. rapae]|uniref:Uncharacterized protein n=1 Tax=Fusarium oxysporum f. sp. rapae TaxID=485398 RepID=A0A8J5U5D8_FUSOX|nr:hypothetical protein Forpe1208_v010006 [Fusarium oxysporum f. sp. rapae]
MPNFRPLFFIAKVLTCCCCCSRRRPENTRASNQPYGTRHDQRTGSSSENVSDYSEYSVPPAYPGGPMNLIHPDEFEHSDELDEVHGRDEFGFDLQKSRSIVPCPPTPRPSSPATSEPGTTMPSTAKSTTTKTISDEPVAGPSVIAETTATDSVTEKPLADEPGTPKPVVVEPITDEPALVKSVVAEPEATGFTTKRLVADEPSATKLAGPESSTNELAATKSVATEPKPKPEPVEAGPTETKADRPNFVKVDLAEAGPRKSGIEASEVKGGTTEASSDVVGPTENKDEDKGKDKVSD